MIYRYTVILTILFFLSGCAPSFSEFQTAHLVGEGGIEVTPYFSSTTGESSSSDSDDDFKMEASGDLQSSVGCRITYGLNKKMNLSFDYENIKSDQGFVKGRGLSFGAKFQIISRENYKLSGFLPYSTYKQEISNLPSKDYKFIEPTLLSSYKIAENFNINSSVKLLYPIDEEDIDDIPYAFNLSASFSLPFLPTLTFLPEYGVLFQEGEKMYSHMGVGFIFKLNQSETDKE